MIEHARLRHVEVMGVDANVWSADEDDPALLAVWEDVLEELVFAATYAPERACAAILLGSRAPVAPGSPPLARTITGFTSLTYFDALDVRELHVWSREALGASFDVETGVARIAQRDVLGLFVHVPGSAGRADELVVTNMLSWHNVIGRVAAVVDVEADALAFWARRASGRYRSEPFVTLSRGSGTGESE